MSNILILSPAPIATIAAARGAGETNMLTPDPKEVWVDAAVGSSAIIDIDLGSVQPIDTIFLGHVREPAAGATWTITGGAADYTSSVIKPAGALRVTDATGQFPATSHALWVGGAVAVRYIRMSLIQPAGALPLSVGIAMAGKAFVPAFNKEWGSGRRLIDASTVTDLPSGGFAVVEGARKRAFSWTLGDLTDAEVEAMDAISLDRGEGRPVLVVEDPSATTALRNRIHYGRMRWKAFERRSLGRTRWELEVEEWA